MRHGRRDGPVNSTAEINRAVAAALRFSVDGGVKWSFASSETDADRFTHLIVIASETTELDILCAVKMGLGTPRQRAGTEAFVRRRGRLAPPGLLD
jgi:hypothetical protein